MTLFLLLNLAVFICVIIVTGLIIPQILLIAFRKNLFDEVDPRKIHKGAVPRLGGIAFFPAMLFSILFVLGVTYIASGYQSFIDIPINFGAVSMITCSVTILYLVGMADDLIGVKYRAKFVAQILAGLFLFIGGIYFNDFHGFLWLDEITPSLSPSLSPALSPSLNPSLSPDLTPSLSSGSSAALSPSWQVFITILFTILLTVFITNAINLIDGIDGLASGLSSVAFIFYGIVFYNADLFYYSILSFAALGTLLPFFYYNVFGNVTKHKKIFMGDTGALTIGLLLSALSLRICQFPDPSIDLGALAPLSPDLSPGSSAALSPSNGGINPAVAAFAPLLIPCFDVVRVYFRRIRRRKNPFLPDKTHIHHKLLALGVPQRLAMPILVLSSVALTILTYFLGSYLNITFVFIIDIAIWIIANILLTRFIHRREIKKGKPLFD